LYRTSRPLIDDAAQAAGRDPADIGTVYNHPGRITAKPLKTVRDHTGRWIGGSASQWIEELTGAVIEHGASGFLFFPADESPLDMALGRWAREIVPAVRESIARQA